MIENPTMAGWIAAYRHEREKVTDPRALANIDMLIRHSQFEIDREWDELMTTLTDDAAYHVYTVEPTMVLDKQAALENYANPDAVGGLLREMQMDMERFLATPEAISMDGVLYTRLHGDRLAMFGLELPEGASPQDEFLVAVRAAIFITFQDGLMAGEDTYMGVPRIAKQLTGG